MDDVIVYTPEKEIRFVSVSKSKKDHGLGEVLLSLSQTLTEYPSATIISLGLDMTMSADDNRQQIDATIHVDNEDNVIKNSQKSSISSSMLSIECLQLEVLDNNTGQSVSELLKQSAEQLDMLGKIIVHDLTLHSYLNEDQNEVIVLRVYFLRR